MATISPVTLAITRIPNTTPALVRFNLNYTITGSNHDIASEMSYREICQIIGDDTPGDGTDDILNTLVDSTLTFSGINTGFGRGFSLVLPLSSLDEDSGGPAIQEDEIRARVTLTPIPTSRESNLVQVNVPVFEQAKTAARA